MDQTRRSLHGVGELLIAGPQYRAHGTIRMRVTAGGFGGVALTLRVEGTDLVWADGRAPLAGTYRALAAAAGLVPGPPEGSYHDTSGVDLDEEIRVDAATAGRLAEWFARGDAAMRSFAADSVAADSVAVDREPVLWPEHFDLAVTFDEVNYGVSPGDAAHPEPYAYVGPWTPRRGGFWNADFGALRAATDLPDAAAVAAFFAHGRAAAVS